MELPKPINLGNIYMEFIMAKPSLKNFGWKTYREYVTWKGET